MLKYLPLLWANLGRKRIRTALTLASVVIAFLLYGLLQTMNAALTGGAELAGVDRLMTIHKISLIQPLPSSYLNRIRSVEGVKLATSQDWFGGIYQDDRNQVASFAVEPELFFEMYPEYSLPEDRKAAWIADRQGIIVGQSVAQRFGWKVGDRISLRSNIYSNKDGTTAWDFNICGIYAATNGDSNSVYFHYKYFNEARTFGEDNIGYAVVRIDDPDRAAEIAAKIDALFANSSAETKTSTEKAFIQGFANQLGNIGALIARAHQRNRRDEDARILEPDRHGAGARRGDADHGARRLSRTHARLAAGGRARQCRTAIFPDTGHAGACLDERRSADRHARRARGDPAVRAGVQAQDRRRTA